MLISLFQRKGSIGGLLMGGIGLIVLVLAAFHPLPMLGNFGLILICLIASIRFIRDLFRQYSLGMKWAISLDLISLCLMAAIISLADPFVGFDYTVEAASRTLALVCMLLIAGLLFLSAMVKGPWTWRLQRIFALILLSTAGLIMIQSEKAPSRPGHAAIEIGGLSLLILAIIRQSLLLFERQSALETQRNLREQEDQLEILLEYCNDVLFQLEISPDGSFRYQSISQGFEKLTEIKASEVLGKTPTQVFPSESGEKLVAHLESCVIEGNPLRFEHLMAMPKNLFWFDSMLIPLRNKEGKVNQIIGISKNITASKNTLESIHRTNKEMEETIQLRAKELETACREMEMFSYSVSHDLRTPLRGVNGFCQALREDYSGILEEKALGYLDRISAASDHMGSIIDDLLQLSRAARAPLEWQKINLSKIASSIYENLQLQQPRQNVSFEIQPDMTVQGDYRLLGIALRHLLENAWKYTCKRSWTRIKFAQMIQDGRDTFYVEDNGVGFDETYLSKLFKPFQRLHDSSDFTGTGIGLSIVSRIIERHQGTIWATGKVNSGATFYFTLASVGFIPPSRT